RLTLLVADLRRCDQLRLANAHLLDGQVAVSRQQPVIRRRLDLAAALAAHPIDELLAGLDDPLDLVWPDAAVRPHRHDLGDTLAVRLRQPHPRAVREDDSRLS